MRRTLKSFYDDQMTHHAAALTYYSLMSLFPAVLLALSLLGLVGQYPEHLQRDHRVPARRRAGVGGRAARQLAARAFQAKGTAATTLGSASWSRCTERPACWKRPAER